MSIVLFLIIIFTLRMVFDMMSYFRQDVRKRRRQTFPSIVFKGVVSLEKILYLGSHFTEKEQNHQKNFSSALEM